MAIELEAAALNLAVALACGAAVGMERQWRQRLAGLRTNTLVALGAASFVVFAAIFPDEISPKRVAAQIVSGIGFLGAGAWDFALLMTTLVVFVNLALRPLARLLNRQPIETTEISAEYEVEIVCRHAQEAHVRALMLQGFAEAGLHLTSLESRDIEDSDRVTVSADLNADGTSDSAMETIVGRMSLEPAVTAARWQRRQASLN